MLRIPHESSLTLLRDFLSEAGYTANRLRSELGLGRGLYANLENLAPLLERTNGDALLPLLGRLFFIGWPAAIDLSRKHIPEQILQLCQDSGLLAIEDNSFSPAAVIVPFENVLLFAADAPRLRGTNPNIVIGPSSATSIVANSLFRTPAGTVLDICTGSGVLAIIAASFSDSVIGTDINERAVEFARFNAALNGVENVEFVAGDAFAPAEGKAFDRIIANPPFFLAPKKNFTYSDSPLKLDGFTRKLAMEAPRYLKENGVFQMVCEWVEVEGEPWEQRLHSWTSHSGCDVFVYVGPSSDPLNYSENRFHEAGSLHTGDTSNFISERVKYFREHRVRKVLSGVITMRKRKGVNWFSAIAGDLSIELGKIIEERVNARTIISEYTEEQWLQAKLRFAPDALIIQSKALKENGWDFSSIEVAKPSCIKDPLVVDLPVLGTIELFDGSNTLAAIIQKTAEALALSPDEAKSRCFQLAKRLVRSGFVLPTTPKVGGIQE